MSATRLNTLAHLCVHQERMAARRCQDDSHARPSADACGDDGMACLRLQRGHVQAVQHILCYLVEVPAAVTILLALDYLRADDRPLACVGESEHANGGKPQTGVTIAYETVSRSLTPNAGT